MHLVAKGLRSHRDRLGLCAEGLWKVLGVSARSVYNWERGKARIRQQRIERLVHLSRPIDERLLGSGVEWRDDDEALPREVKQKIAMTQRRSRGRTTAM